MTTLLASASTPASDPSSIDKLIDFELSRIDVRQRNQGWTPWALYAALGGLIWLGLKEFEEGKLDYLHGIPLWGLVAYTHFALKALRALVSDRKTSIGSSNRFSFSNQEMGSQRGHVFVYIVRSIVAFLIVKVSLLPVPPHERLIFYAFSYVMGLMFIIMLCMSYFDVPVPKGDERKIKDYVIGVIVAGSATYVAYCLWKAFISEGVVTSLSAWKFAILVFAVGEVLEWLLVFRSDEPYLNSLVSIKRDLALGNISAATAKSQLEVTLLGMRVGHLVQGPIKKYLSLAESVEQKLRHISEQQEKMLALLRARSATLSGDDEELIRTRLAVIKTTFGEAKTMMSSVEDVRNGIRRKVQLLARLAPNCAKDIESIRDEMTASLEKIKLTAKRGGEIFKELHGLLKESNKPELAALLTDVSAKDS